MLKLTGEIELVSCPACDGKGKVKHEDWQRRDGKWVQGGGFLPCEMCRGKKVVESGKRGGV